MRVVIPEEKFYSYALDFDRQPNKAIAFRDSLGYTKINYQSLIDQIKKGFNEGSLLYRGNNGYGDLYELVLTVEGINGKRANVCTGWIFFHEKDEYYMTSVYVTRRRPKNDQTI